MIRQRTLHHPISANGIGLHSGRVIRMCLLPAPIDHGIVFRRVDLKPARDYAAQATLVGNTTMSTTLGPDGLGVATIEHLMAAFSGMGIDNALIELDGPEVPIMDGSASPFVFLLQSAGIVEQRAAKSFIRILSPIIVKDGDKRAELHPHNGFRVRFAIDFEHPAIKAGPQKTTLDFSTSAFIREVSRARTFGFSHDVERLRAAGLALGGSVSNAIVLDEFNILNEDGLRYPDEFVRHKALDAVGDLSLLHGSLIGEYRGFKSGHALNNALLHALLDQSDCWEQTFFTGDDAKPVAFADTIIGMGPAVTT